MMKEQFRVWLEKNVKSKEPKKLVGNYMSYPTLVEKYYEDLDDFYNNGSIMGLINEFTYTKEDERQKKENPTRIPIEGNIYNKLKNVRRLSEQYKEFRDETQPGPASEEPASGLTKEEGRRRWRKQKAAERDPRLSNAAMELNREKHGGRIECEACGFSDADRSMFDAHHLEPLALGERESTVDDLAVLCPTCHRWAHEKAHDKKQPLSVERIRQDRLQS